MHPPHGAGQNYRWTGADDGDLKVGEIYGLRVWKVQDDGWLTGVSYHSIWKPGPNRSECWQKTGYETGGIVTAHRPTTVTQHRKDGEWADVEPGTRPDGPFRMMYRLPDGSLVHNLPEMVFGNNEDPNHSPHGCRFCGFHGFTSGNLAYTNTGDKDKVAGVVKAWGRMVWGTKGFRAEWAQPVALLVMGEQAENYGGFRLPPTPRASEWGPVAPTDSRLTSERRAAMEERYPAVPVFLSLGEMLDRFPTTPPKPKKEEVES